MPNQIWDKYKIIKEINTDNPIIKTYLTKIEPIVKEIIPKNNADYFEIIEKIKKLKDELDDNLNIYDMIQENDRLYIV